MKGISAAAYGRLHGKSDTAVFKHWKSGRLQRFDDGSFDPNQPWPGTEGGGQTENAPQTVELDQTENDVDNDEFDIDAELDALEGGNLTDARKHQTIIKAQLQKLQLERAKKSLVPLKHVQRHVEKIFVHVKQTILHIPARHASQIAAKLGCDPVVLEAELKRAITLELNDLSSPVLPAD